MWMSAYTVLKKSFEGSNDINRQCEEGSVWLEDFSIRSVFFNKLLYFIIQVSR